MQSLQSPCVAPLLPPEAIPPSSEDGPVSRLPLELIGAIAAALGAPRCVRLAAVCSDWRAAVKCVLAEQNSDAWRSLCASRSPLLASLRSRLDDGSGALTWKSIHDKHRAAVSSPLQVNRLSIVADDGPAADRADLLLGLELRVGREVRASAVAPWSGVKMHGDFVLARFAFAPFACAADELDELRLTLFIARRDDAGVLCFADGLAGDGEGDGWYVWDMHASDDAGVANARLNATLTFAGMSPPPFGKNRDADESYDVSGAEFKLYARTLKQDTRCERELRRLLEVLDGWH